MTWQFLNEYWADIDTLWRCNLQLVADFLLQKSDQILLLQNSWAELTCLGVIWRSRNTKGLIQLSYGKTIDLAKAKEMDHEEVGITYFS